MRMARAEEACSQHRRLDHLVADVAPDRRSRRAGADDRAQHDIDDALAAASEAAIRGGKRTPLVLVDDDAAAKDHVIAGQRMHRNTLKDGTLDPRVLEQEVTGLTEAIVATLGAWRGRRASPVYQQLPNLREPVWKTIKVGDVNEYCQGLATWQTRVNVALGKQRPGDILVLAEETPNSILEFEALRTAGDALLH